MKKILLYIFVHTINLAFAQNLVKNPSFEDISGCPVTYSYLDDALFWHIPHVTTTPDLYHVCALQPEVAVPSNGLGYQMPHTGNAYAGIFTFNVDLDTTLGCDFISTRTWVEYIQGELTTPLTTGQTYCVSFWVSLAEGCTYGATNMAVYFSDTLISPNTSALPIPVMPQLVNTVSPMDNLDEWQQLEWTYTAKGGERFLCIGNFDEANATNFFHNNCNAALRGAYYYIDDVSVKRGTCSSSGLYFEGVSNAFTPNSDGVNDSFFPLGTTNQYVFEFKVFNRWGQVVHDKSNTSNAAWDGTFQGVPQPSEAYLYLLRYQIQGQQQEIVLRGEVMLIR